MFTKITYGSLLTIPLAFAARFLGWGDAWVFVYSAIAIFALAATLGDATEQVCIYTGPKIGGMLSATLGNVPELLIGFFAVLKGPALYSFVMASVIGSVIGNTMLVMGCSAFVGGVIAKIASCNRNIPRFNFTLLVFALFALATPAILQGAGVAKGHVLHIGLGVSICMILVYIANLYFSLYTHKAIFESTVFVPDASFGSFATGSVMEAEEEEPEEAKWSLRKALLILVLTMAAIAVMSEFLVGSVEIFAEKAGLPMTFIGIVLMPILGNVAEQASAIIMAARGKMGIAVEIAVGSGTQIALFVTPLLVVISYLLVLMSVNGEAMALVFTPFELLSLAGAIAMGAYMLMDGCTNWMEGLILIASYIVVCIGFFFA
jgi:Ca2+:H+ antiporter